MEVKRWNGMAFTMAIELRWDGYDPCSAAHRTIERACMRMLAAVGVGHGLSRENQDEARDRDT